ncbi:unnamed protein product [Prunus brigantina]
MSFEDGSKAPNSQAPLYLWGGSIVHNKKFVANLHRVTTEAQFQKWRAADDHYLPSFLFLLRLQIPVVKALQGGVLCHGVWSEPVYSQCLPGDHVLREFEPFLHVGADVSDISKQLELGPDMAKVGRALNIPLRFREWHWLLSEYQEEDSGLPPAEDCSAESPPKRKVATKSSRGEAISSHAKNGSSSRKEPRLPTVEKTQVESAPSSSARVKHLVGADSTKVGGMRCARGVLPKPPADTLENHDICFVRQQEMQTFLLKSRAVKCGVDSVSLTPLEMRLAEAKRTRESSARAKGSSPA